MEYTCIYEALPNRSVILPVIILCILELCMAIYGIINWKYNAVSGKIGICLISFLLLFFITCSVYYCIVSYTIWDTYQNGDYLIAEGIIEDYKVENEGHPDKFTVNGSYFYIPKPAGWEWEHDDGSRILHNGQYCKIFYVPYKYENVIMKILLVQESD